MIESEREREKERKGENKSDCARLYYPCIMFNDCDDKRSTMMNTFLSQSHHIAHPTKNAYLTLS